MQRTTNFQERANFIWSVAEEVPCEDFKGGKYLDVILPFTVLRRLDCAVALMEELLLVRYAELQVHTLPGWLGL